MSEPVNDPVTDRRAARVAETERRILAAAAELFVRDGYQATTLTAVAEAAGVAHRTVYVRFGTKVALLRRTVDVAVAGDTEDRSVAEREWAQEALSAPTLAERIDALVDGTVALMGRAADLFEVALQAQSGEPELVEAFTAGRAATRQMLHGFVDAACRDGLAVPADDPDWQRESVALSGQAETHLLLRRTTGWSPEQYGDWLRRTLTALLPAR
ncbi:MAG TPA: helix-turn-helix domain-containing protein [Nocardioides sp.]|nr:helix-turn-helix domain-containing protein [Nocardioides sp.]